MVAKIAFPIVVFQHIIKIIARSICFFFHFFHFYVYLEIFKFIIQKVFFSLKTDLYKTSKGFFSFVHLCQTDKWFQKFIWEKKINIYDTTNNKTHLEFFAVLLREQQSSM